MVVLACTAAAFIVAVMLSSFVLLGELDVYVRFAVLLLAHGAAGWASWNAGLNGWGDRVLWMLAISLHTATYTINWQVYAIEWGAVIQEYPNPQHLTEGEVSLLQNLVILGVIALPTLLMLGGPLRAMLITAPQHQERG